jgi:transposase
MYRLLGTDLTQIDGISAVTAQIFFSEVGRELDKFPTKENFTSWLGLCPSNKISGGKILSSRTRPGVNRFAQALKMAAMSLWHSQSYLGSYFRRMRSKHGSPKAITATLTPKKKLIRNKCYAILKIKRKA